MLVSATSFSSSNSSLSSSVGTSSVKPPSINDDHDPLPSYASLRPADKPQLPFIMKKAIRRQELRLGGGGARGASHTEGGLGAGGNESDDLDDAFFASSSSSDSEDNAPPEQEEIEQRGIESI